MFLWLYGKSFEKYIIALINGLKRYIPIKKQAKPNEGIELYKELKISLESREI